MILATLPLWEAGAPGALGQGPEHTPDITPYLPDQKAATGAAMVILPGGGYRMLAQHEGHDYALWLNTLGITCFVVSYRLGGAGYRHPSMLNDAARAVRFVRAQAEQWQIDPERIGIMGSSAGGHLASTLLTHFEAGDPDASDPIERVSSRPNLGVLCYAVISMGPIGHEGSRENLLGESPSEEMIRELSNELQVKPDTPPCFIWHTWEDPGVKVENSLAFAQALRAQGIPFDLHIYHSGRHGIGLNDKEPFSNLHPWAKNLAFWLQEQGFC